MVLNRTNNHDLMMIWLRNVGGMSRRKWRYDSVIAINSISI